MSLQHNSEILPMGTQFSFGGRQFSSVDAARDHRAAQMRGQVTDRTTGLVGRNGAELLAKAKAQGMSGAALDALLARNGM